MSRLSKQQAQELFRLNNLAFWSVEVSVIIDTEIWLIAQPDLLLCCLPPSKCQELIGVLFATSTLIKSKIFLMCHASHKYWKQSCFATHFHLSPFSTASVPSPHALFQVSLSISHQFVLHRCFIHFFPSLKHSNDGRAFTVFTSFKTNTWHSAVPVETFDGSVLHSELSELPAPEHSCTPH